MNPATTEFLRQRFTEYYRKAVLVAPPSLVQREWGFILFSPQADVRMRRHIGFSDRGEMESYIQNLIPQHTYFSTAYYEKPDAGTMADKGWSGADLIFDLDADHIVRGPYDQMLARVKEETEKLLAILTGEFAMDKKAIALVFSGGRGYHVHVRDLAFRSWGSAERRELIDYVCGIGINPAAMLTGTPEQVPGWQKRFQETLLEYLEWLKSQDPAVAFEHVVSHQGVGDASGNRLMNDLPNLIGKLRSRPKEILVRNAQKELWIQNEALRIIVNDDKGEFRKRLLARAALADEPVTTDTKRLIRMPTSLHGGSGMRVQPLELRDLHDFDPLTDAVVFGTRDVKVDQKFPLKMPMLGSTYELQKGINTVPEAVAVFLCCRGTAEIA